MKYLFNCAFLLISTCSAGNIFNNVGGSLYFDNAGQLSPLNPSTVTVDNIDSGNLVIAGNGRYAYVTNLASKIVFQFIIGIDGQLAPLAPFKTPTGNGPYDIKITSDGKYAYVSNKFQNDVGPQFTISQYSIGANGQLNPLSPASVAALGNITKIAITPDNKFLYSVSDSSVLGSKYVGQSSIGTDGQLHDLDPYAVETNGNSSDIAVTPTGKYVYITNPSMATISQYSIGINGQLTPLNPSLVSSFPNPTEMVITPNGKFVYLIAEDKVVQYSINTNGQLTPLNPPAVSGLTNADKIIITPNGKFAYVSEDGDQKQPSGVLQFSVGTNGQLTPLDPFTVDTAINPYGIAITPDSQYLYISDYSSTNIYQYRIKVSK